MDALRVGIRPGRLDPGASLEGYLFFDKPLQRRDRERRYRLVWAFRPLTPIGAPPALAQYSTPQLVQKLSGLSEKLELTTNTSRILTLDKNIPRVQVNNPDLLAVTPLSANQVQISAKKAGVTQVNLWDEDGNIHTVDVLIYGDVKELEVALQTQFPNSSIRVYRYSESLVLKGFVDQPEHVSQIIQLSSDYAPKRGSRLAQRSTRGRFMTRSCAMARSHSRRSKVSCADGSPAIIHSETNVTPFSFPSSALLSTDRL